MFIFIYISMLLCKMFIKLGWSISPGRVLAGIRMHRICWLWMSKAVKSQRVCFRAALFRSWHSFKHFLNSFWKPTESSRSSDINMLYHRIQMVQAYRPIFHIVTFKKHHSAFMVFWTWCKSTTMILDMQHHCLFRSRPTLKYQNTTEEPASDLNMLLKWI